MANKIKQRWLIRILLCTAGVFLIVSFALFIGRHVVAYSSPEDAYKSVYGGEIYLVVEGNESDYVIGSKEAKFFTKSDSGWKVPIINIAITKGISHVGSTTIYVSQYNFSDEYYVTVIDPQKSTLELKDNCNSTFYKLDNHENASNVMSCVYYTYVNKITDQYSITVNGEEVKLFE